MNIACLAWGSLLWKPGELPVAGGWMIDGPALPIEFARVGDKGELATVITPGQVPVRVRWARLAEQDLTLARQALQKREEIREDEHLGFWIRGGRRSGYHFEGTGEIARWATLRLDIDAVIWTALPPRFDGTDGWVPNPTAAGDYLRGLTGQIKAHAVDYVQRVPADIRTSNRLALEHAISETG